MAKQSPIFISLLLVINIVAGFVLSCYPIFNMVMNCVVLCIALILIYFCNKKEMEPAYRMSLAFILPTFTIIELIIGCFSPSHIKDNWGIIAILCCMAFESLLIYSVIRKSLTKTK